MKHILTILTLTALSSAASAALVCKSSDGRTVGTGPAMVFKNESIGYVPVYADNGKQPLGILMRGHYYYPAKCTINGCTFKSPTLRIRLEPKTKKLIVQRPGEMPVITKLTGCREMQSE